MDAHNIPRAELIAKERRIIGDIIELVNKREDHRLIQEKQQELKLLQKEILADLNEPAA